MLGPQDDTITPADALLAFQHFLGIADPPLDACQQDRANVDDPEDSEITPADALCIFQEFLDLPSCLMAHFDFALDTLSVDGNIKGGGDADGNPEFIDEFDTALGPEYNCLSGITVRDSFLIFTDSDGIADISAPSPADLCDLLPERPEDFRDIVLEDGEGDATIVATFRADVPVPFQHYGVRLLSLDSGNEQVGISVVSFDNRPHIDVDAPLLGFAQLVPIDLDGKSRIELRMHVNDATNHVSMSYRLDGGSLISLAFPSEAKIFTDFPHQAFIRLGAGARIPEP